MATHRRIDAYEIRARLDWTQEDLARYIGCDQATVSRLEGGRDVPPPVYRMLELLDRDLRLGVELLHPSAGPGLRRAERSSRPNSRPQRSV